MTAKKATATGSGATRKTSQVFTAEERAAMKERAKEIKAAANKADGEKGVLAKLDEMPEPDRALGKQLHEIVKASAPDLTPKLWYGMPSYANEDGKVVCFYQNADKFKSRFSTFNFSDDATLDEGSMWPVSFAVTKLTATNEAKIRALVKKAVS
ncbi:MAG TPA: DUF1801 domain-containing protein [Actinomycetota bacterium]|nr:DUF1801 domain-containing protein [Actinomycetota bacterium]